MYRAPIRGRWASVFELIYKEYFFTCFFNNITLFLPARTRNFTQKMYFHSILNYGVSWPLAARLDFPPDWPGWDQLLLSAGTSQWESWWLLSGPRHTQQMTSPPSNIFIFHSEKGWTVGWSDIGETRNWTLVMLC